MPWSPVPEPEKTAVDYVRHRLSSHDSILPPGLRHDSYSVDLTDSSGGLLAFVRHDDSSVVVYDPWTLKCREVNLPAATTPASEQLVSPCLGAFFLDADDDTSCLSMLNFRLLWVCFVSESEGDDDIRRFTAKAFIFSASENRWIFMNSTGGFVPVWVRGADGGQHRMVPQRRQGDAPQRDLR
ncbi:hypothetical protein HU200_003457 [Digitaria exilis]|uniref:Uncharacterized protein n=1 Tax=Digitaria exilis TaxID=1010633 RepID=A0A835KUI3_9POAL|nr:hypothetical protein HU200_003457 [Digitaria exilis]